jgi:hypothetical protein
MRDSLYSIFQGKKYCMSYGPWNKPKLWYRRRSKADPFHLLILHNPIQKTWQHIYVFVYPKHPLLSSICFQAMHH